jgi:hypothetical protein
MRRVRDLIASPTLRGGDCVHEGGRVSDVASTSYDWLN